MELNEKLRKDKNNEDTIIGLDDQKKLLKNLNNQLVKEITAYNQIRDYELIQTFDIFITELDNYVKGLNQ
jgi:hypothetical protein